MRSPQNLRGLILDGWIHPSFFFLSSSSKRAQFFRSFLSKLPNSFITETPRTYTTRSVRISKLIMTLQHFSLSEKNLILEDAFSINAAKQTNKQTNWGNIKNLRSFSSFFSPSGWLEGWIYFSLISHLIEEEKA